MPLKSDLSVYMQQQLSGNPGDMLATSPTHKVKNGCAGEQT